MTVGMATTLALVPPRIPTERSPSIYSNVPLEDVWREEQLP